MTLALTAVQNDANIAEISSVVSALLIIANNIKRDTYPPSLGTAHEVQYCSL